MSVKNKTFDRDHNGRIKRKYTGPWSTYWLGHTPGWWVKLYMSRPRRRQNKRCCMAVLKGKDPDGLVFPLGNHRPHEYYW
jgi:hypothetical protein